MLIPEFSENKDNSMLLYFSAEKSNIREIFDELEKTYVCFEKMSQQIKDGKLYAVMEIKDEE